MPAPFLVKDHDLRIDALIAPIAGDDPRGADLWRREIKDNFDEYRKEVVKFDKGATALARPKIETPGRWDLIIEQSREILAEKTKDLFVAVRMTEALLKRHQFAGLADGLTVVRRLIEECWDRLYPDIDDGDVEVRGTPITWLDDPERLNSFPMNVRSTPLVGDFCWIDFFPSTMTEGRPVDKATEERRKQATVVAGAAGSKHWGPIAEQLGHAQDQIRVLDDLLVAKMGEELAPSLRNLRNAVVDCLDLARTYLPKAAEAPAEKKGGGADNADDGTTGASPASAPRAAETRAEIYESLSEAATKLQRIEPHSPIPYLIQRAVELGQMPFPQLMKALISDAKVIEDLNRGLGIKADAPPAK